MAGRSRSRSRSRDPSVIASSAGQRFQINPEYTRWLARHAWVSDYRRWDPTVRRVGSTVLNRVARATDGTTRASRLVPRSHTQRRRAGGGRRVMGLQDGTRYPPFGVGFADPSRVIICLRRKQRREVLFAAGRTGRRGMRRFKRNEFSAVRC